MTNIFAPFEPESDEPRRRRFKPIPVRVLLPNLVTLLALCLGLTAIRMAMEGRLELAIGAIVLAAILDGLDGLRTFSVSVRCRASYFMCGG
jgi:CDP-diacylglycerol--serine O-phosphatidyltransferase